MRKVSRGAKAAFRSLLRRPTFALVAVAILTLGIGATTAIFTLLNAIVLRPLPIPHPEELVRISTAIADDVNGDQPLSLPMFYEIERACAGVTNLFAWNAGAVSNIEVNGSSFTANTSAVSGNYYLAVDVVPSLGRFIQPSDVALDHGVSNAVAVLSYRAWRKWYRSDPSVIGKTIRIEKHPFTVIGVEPQEYSGLIIDGASDVTVPVLAPGQAGTEDIRNPRLLWLTVYGRTLPGLTVQQARARLEAAWPHIQQAATRIRGSTESQVLCPEDRVGLRLQRRFILAQSVFAVVARTARPGWCRTSNSLSESRESRTGQGRRAAA